MKKVIFSLFLCVLLSLSLFAQETITLTTYYPAPFGVYQNMRIHSRLSVGDVNGDGVIDDNDLAQDSSGNPINGTITIGNAIGVGTVSPDSELHITSTDGINGHSSITLTGLNPSTGDRASDWEITSLGSGGNDGNGTNSGGLQISTTSSTGVTTTPLSIEQGAPANSLYIDDSGNVGLGTNDMDLTSPVNNISSGNLEVNDIYLRSVDGWASQMAGGLQNFAFAEGRTDVSTTSKTFVPMPDMSLTLTTTGRPVLINFSVVSENDDDHVYFALYVNGARRSAGSFGWKESAHRHAHSGSVYVVNGLSAGTHTFSVYWCVDKGRGHNRVVTYPNWHHRTLFVAEL